MVFGSGKAIRSKKGVALLGRISALLGRDMTERPPVSLPFGETARRLLFF